MLLEEAHFAHTLRGNSAGGNIGYRSSGKFHGHGHLDEAVEPNFQKATAHLRMRNRRDSHACGVRASEQLLQSRQDWSLEFCGNSSGTLRILVEDSHEFRAIEFAIHASVVAPKFPCAHDGDTDLLRISRRRSHSFFIPFKAALGSGVASGLKA